MTLLLGYGPYSHTFSFSFACPKYFIRNSYEGLMIKTNFELTWKIIWLDSQTYHESGSHSSFERHPLSKSTCLNDSFYFFIIVICTPKK